MTSYDSLYSFMRFLGPEDVDPELNQERASHRLPIEEMGKELGIQVLELYGN